MRLEWVADIMFSEVSAAIIVFEPQEGNAGKVMMFQGNVVHTKTEEVKKEFYKRHGEW